LLTLFPNIWTLPPFQINGTFTAAHTCT